MECPCQPRAIDGVVFFVAVVFVLPRGQSEQQPGQIKRRLISLIFAGRNRMIMIRRGATSDCYRESGRACRTGQTRIILRACSGCCWLCARDGWRGSSMSCLCFFLIREIIAFALFFSGSGSLADDHFGSGSNSLMRMADEPYPYPSMCIMGW